MTLEEKKKELENSGNAMWALSDIWHEVDKIYDDFEKELDKAKIEGYRLGRDYCFILLTGKDK